MENVVLVIHLIFALAIIFLVLIQRSEGGGLGIGGSGGGGLGNFASPKGTANALNKLTRFCAAAFFATSLTLAVLAGTHSGATGILDDYKAPAAATGEAAAVEGAPAADAENLGTEAQDESAINTETKTETGAEETPAKPSVPLGE